MVEEFNALLQNGTWSLVLPPPQANVVGSTWKFRIKYRADGSIDRYKARLVAQGFHQQSGKPVTSQPVRAPNSPVRTRPTARPAPSDTAQSASIGPIQ
ncbi:hypothetical protein CRG98_000288 [Punica granatum]|uniref:Reverse transcriptase Ty1/copia-type domain-containing protein n=1 Tax=Punica granatum TaxID=22663 RepID=A0A2I0LFA7_PUNGR|nr:hypothetical protein CRG98_000288 [Punica granatum]